eukprot:snap_masked-scaffold_103-processed-gene-0.25-mRNA-1 protein AED:1.00 eAED:1.00 QI:0/0/0/0/1/1/2/0/87
MQEDPTQAYINLWTASRLIVIYREGIYLGVSDLSAEHFILNKTTRKVVVNRNIRPVFNKLYNKYVSHNQNTLEAAKDPASEFNNIRN